MMRKNILVIGIVCLAFVAIVVADSSVVRAELSYPVVGRVETPDGDPVEGIMVRFYIGFGDELVLLGFDYTNANGLFSTGLPWCGVHYFAIVGLTGYGPFSIRWVECDPLITTDFGTIVIDGKLIPHH